MNYLTCSYELSRADIILFSLTLPQQFSNNRWQERKKLRCNYYFDKENNHVKLVHKVITHSNTFFIYINLFILFIYFWLRWVFVAACRLSLVAVSGATLHCRVRASHCSGFSCCGAWALGAWASVVVAHGLQSAGSVVVAPGHSCSVACGIFLEQGSNPCPLHWQADS